MGRKDWKAIEDPEGVKCSALGMDALDVMIAGHVCAINWGTRGVRDLGGSCMCAAL
jgi:hypothetical protein